MAAVIQTIPPHSIVVVVMLAHFLAQKKQSREKCGMAKEQSYAYNLSNKTVNASYHPHHASTLLAVGGCDAGTLATHRDP